MNHGSHHASCDAGGGTDQGAPGLRDPNFYAGYFRNRDGDKPVAYYPVKAKPLPTTGASR